MGKLVLVSTPIDSSSALNATTKEILEKLDHERDLILVEDHKPARRRWIGWGLDRERIEDFILFNEHTHAELVDEIIAKIKKGQNAYLISDCGLPAFCDPGQDLVDRAHNSGVQVTATPFYNSISLAVALSGFDHSKFMFEGFIPKKNPERSQALKSILKASHSSVLMDTAYRMGKLIDELIELGAGKREFFLAQDLNKESELLLRGSLDQIKKKHDGQKREFILMSNSLK